MGMVRETARIGVVGCGWWASQAHLPALLRNPRAAIAGLADPDPDKLAHAKERFAVESAFGSSEDLFAAVEIDAVVIAVPHAFHFQIARLALEHDLHVLLEKPMVLEPEDGRTLVDMAKRRGLEIIVGYPWHYNPQVLAVREAMAHGAIGELEFVSCLFASIVRELYRGDPAAYADEFGYTWNAPSASTYSDPSIAGGGQGQTQITHASALLFWMTGLRPREVFAYSEAHELDVDLADTVSLRFSNGAIGSIASTGSMTTGHQEVLEYRLFGRDGHVLFDVNNAACAIHGLGGSVRELSALSPGDRYPEAAPVNNLVGVVLGEEDNGSPPEVGQLAVEFLAAMYRSTREGTPIRLSVVPD